MFFFDNHFPTLFVTYIPILCNNFDNNFMQVLLYMKPMEIRMLNISVVLDLLCA